MDIPEQAEVPEPSASTRYRRSAAAEPQAVSDLRREVVSFARTMGADDGACEAIQLSVSEAVTNAVVHAYVGRAPGRITVEAWLEEPEHLEITVTDDGLGMVPRVDSPGLGLGFSLMTQMAETVNVTDRHNGTGTSVALRFLLSATPSPPPTINQTPRE